MLAIFVVVLSTYMEHINYSERGNKKAALITLFLCTQVSNACLRKPVMIYIKTTQRNISSNSSDPSDIPPWSVTSNNNLTLLFQTP